MPAPYVLPLSEPAATLEAVGGKGASLARMRTAGLPVPGGFHVTTAAYRRFVDENAIQPGILAVLGGADLASPDSLEAASTAIRGLFNQGAIPADIAAAVASAYAGLDGAAVAVRSSATAEDLPEASFAGQQETYLNVRGADAVLAAVRRCWASLWTARAISYRARQGISPESVALAVVVQALVPAEAAGILFTANPVTGDHGQAVISAAWGLGEAVVGGLVTPDSLTVDKASGQIVAREIADKPVMTVRVDGGTQEQPVPEALRRQPALNEEAIADLVRLGKKIEQLYGMAMDVEWALANGKIAIVQARPITALPEHEPAPPTEWKLPPGAYVAMRNNIVELMAEPLSPLFDTLGRAAINASLGRLLSDFFGRTDLMPQEVIISVNHYAYFNGSLSAGQMGRIVLDSVGIARRMFRGAVERWTEVGRPRYVATVEGWQATPWQEFPAMKLVQAARELSQAAIDAYGALVGGVIPAAWISEGLFTAVYKALIKRRDDPLAPVYLLGFDSRPILAEKSLYDLAQWARTHDGLAAYLLATPAAQVLAQGESAPQAVEAETWRAWRNRFDQHLQRYGHAIYNLDFATPVPADHAEPLVETCKLFMAGQGVDPYARQQAAAERREQATDDTLSRLGGMRRRLFRRVLAPAQKYAPLREDGLADVGLSYPLLREMLLELGRRFAAGGMLDKPDDIFWLTQDEVAEAVARLDRSDELGRLAHLVPQRRAINQAARRVSPPRMLPQIGRRQREGAKQEKRRRRGDERIKGVAASPGSVTATARVLHGPEDFDRMRPGDVLVAAITTPAWTPLFAMAAGVVTDIGGPLSHGSIVAREYGIPAVLGAGNATQRIRDGQTITVDGTAGLVQLHASPVVWTMPDPGAWYARGSLCEHLPDPVSPLFATLGVRLANVATAELAQSLTTDQFDYGYEVINGYLYLGTKLGWREIWIYVKMSARVMGAMFRGGTERWLKARQRLVTAVSAWEARSPEMLTPGELLAGARELFLEAARYYTVIQAGVLPTATSSETVFKRVYHLASHAGDPDAVTLLFGFDTAPIRAEEALYDLAQWIAARPALKAYVLSTPNQALLADLRVAVRSSGFSRSGVPTAEAVTTNSPPPDDWPEWRARFQAYLDEFGRTVYDFDFANPTPAEAPEPLLEAIKMYLAGQGVNPHERQRVTAERREQATAQVLAHARWPFRGLLRRALGWAQRSAPVREDSLADLGMAHPQIRRLLGELGRRLADAGAIAEASDIYWLQEQEVEQLAVQLERGETVPTFEERVAGRKRETELQRRLTAPVILPETSRLAKMMPWSEQRQEDQTMLKGTSTGSGKVTAPACVLFGPEDFPTMKPGDVLVAVTTTPAWTPLFAMASAVVTDIGGPLSHSSIVAREYGIPAVMATGLATRRIHSGQVITVDGDAGTVELK